MTERSRSRRPPASIVFWISILLFAALFALLAYRFSAEQPAPSAQAVQVRKVIKRRVVTTIVPSPGENTVTASPVSSSSSSATTEPVVTSSS
ncbi:MAG TPA: hypothetical protein VFJ61_12435 [Solirubrobacterales bacterium]|nr:hypothetical protein [Solirubrobacterales bacterium]